MDDIMRLIIQFENDVDVRREWARTHRGLRLKFWDPITGKYVNSMTVLGTVYVENALSALARQEQAHPKTDAGVVASSSFTWKIARGV